MVDRATWLIILLLLFPSLRASAEDQLKWRNPQASVLAPVPQLPTDSAQKPNGPTTTGSPTASIQQTAHYDPLAPGTQPLTGQPPSRTPASVARNEKLRALPSQPTASQTAPSGLPSDSGQVWREYDLRPFTRRANAPGEKPQQEIVDWVLRETGTETWFAEPFGALSASRDSLRVYHTPEIQKTVGDIVDRFVSSEQANLSVSAQLLTLSSPNWRTTAMSLMKPVTVQSSGVEAWLLTKENSAVLLSQLRQRSDFRQHNSSNLNIRNGETHQIDRTRPIAYVHSLQSMTQPWGTASLSPAMRQIEEGFRMKISPLMAANSQTIDAVVKVDTNQLEKLSNVWLNAAVGPTPQRAEIQVPQTSSWRLHERFRWPVDQVLVISCGLVASPDLPTQPTGLLKAFAVAPPAQRHF